MRNKSEIKDENIVNELAALRKQLQCKPAPGIDEITLKISTLNALREVLDEHIGSVLASICEDLKRVNHGQR